MGAILDVGASSGAIAIRGELCAPWNTAATKASSTKAIATSTLDSERQLELRTVLGARRLHRAAAVAQRKPRRAFEPHAHFAWHFAWRLARRALAGIRPRRIRSGCRLGFVEHLRSSSCAAL